MGTGSFPGVKCGLGVRLAPHPLLVPWSRKGRAVPLLPLWAVRPVQNLCACTRVNFTFLPFTEQKLHWSGFYDEKNVNPRGIEASAHIITDPKS